MPGKLNILPDAFNWILSNINFFKFPVKLRIKNQEYFSSRTGEILSLAIVAFLCYTLIASDSFSKTNPLIYSKDQVSKQYSWFEFNETNFFFGACLVDGYAKQYNIDPKIASLRALHYHNYYNPVTKLSQTNLTTESLVSCNTTIYSKIMPSMVGRYPYGVCFQNPRFKIGGALTEAETRFVSIILAPCKNSTSNNNTCNSSDDIKNFFTNKRLGYFMTSNVFDPNNYEKPISQTMNTPLIFLDANLRKIRTINLKKVDIETDDNLILSQYSQKESWGLESIQDDIDYGIEDEIFSLMIYATNSVTVHTRIYTKLQESLSALGGIANILVTFGFIFLQVFPANSFRTFLANHLFSFKKASSLKEKSKKTMNFGNAYQVEESISPAKRKAKYSNVNSSTIPEVAKDSIVIESKKHSKNDETSFSKVICKDRPSGNIENFSTFLETNQQPNVGIERRPNQCNGDKEPPILRSEGTEEINDAMTIKNRVKVVIEKKLSGIEKKSPLKKPSTTVKTSNELLAGKFREYSQMKNQKRKLRIDFVDFLKGKKERKRFANSIKALKIAEKKVNEQLDIANIMEKLYEMENLKFVLFSTEQRLLFDLIAKPEILVDDEQETQGFSRSLSMVQSKKGKEELTDQEIIDLAVYYQRIKEHAEDNLDSRLLKLLSKDTKKFFAI